MEKKKTKKKWREIRSAVTMMCVMAAMLSTATYAWFTLTSSPTVTGMQMTATSEGGLVVSDRSTGTYVNALELPIANANANANPVNLKPVSLNKVGENYGFSKPQYTGGKVTGLQGTILDTNGMKGYVAEYTYYIKSENGTVGVGIIAGNKNQSEALTVSNGVANASGTVIRQKADSGDTAAQDASNAMRIGLLIGSADMKDMIIYEPNADATLAAGNTTSAASTYSYDSANFAADVVSNVNGTIVSANPTDAVTSQKLFEVGEEEVEIKMYIWLEGTDAQCVDQIKTDLIEAQIQFTSLGPVTP